MRKSAAVTLILSGSLLTGCDPGPNGIATDDNTYYTNNTYHAGYGYWHAPYRRWYPFPYNYYSPTLGYYHGGNWSSAPEESRVTMSSPGGRGMMNNTSHSHFGGFHSSITRGGFGSFGRGGG